MDPRAKMLDGLGAGERIITMKDKNHFSKNGTAILNGLNGTSYMPRYI